MNETPSIELIIESTEHDVLYADFLSHSTTFVTDEATGNDSCREKYELVNTIEEFEDLLRQHEVEQYTKYTIIKTNGVFKGRGKDPASKPRVHWGVLSKVSPKLATTPYLIVGTRYYVCHLGRYYYANKLKKFSVENESLVKKRKQYKKVTDSKKVGCPAGFKVQRLILFPDNKLSQDSPSDRARMGEYIRENITSIKIDHKYLFKFPDIYEHRNHKEQQVEAEKEPIDKQVVSKIREMVCAGETNVEVLNEVLQKFVESYIKVNDKNRRRFYPSKRDIQRSVYKAKLSLRKKKYDQDKLEELILALGDASEVFFRPSNSDSPFKFSCTNIESRKYGLLFFYQSKEMKRLYNLYGHNCILFDPAYKFCKYSFPLYFIVVQTNVNYQVVGIIFTEVETKDAIVEALNVLYQWNPSVIPRYAMTDNSSDEIKALESIFPEIKVFIPQFYCELTWEARLMRDDMITDHFEALNKLRSIASAATEDAVQKSINDLKYCDSPLLKEYFEKYWQKELKRWTICYRPGDLLFEANDAVDRLYDEFDYVSLSRGKNRTLSEMVLHLCQTFIPQTLQKYKTLNINILRNCKVSNYYIPSYLSQAPQWLVDYILEEISTANKTLPYSYVEYQSDGKFSLLSKISNEKFFVCFSSEQKQVGCTCFRFLKRRIICEHAIIVGRFHPIWTLEKISSWLFNNPIFNLDNIYAASQISDLPQEKNEEILEINIKDVYKENELSMKNTSNESPKESLNTLKKNCKQNLKYLDSLVNNLRANELEEFHENLKELCSTWSSRKQEVTLKANDEQDNDIPFPMLKKIEDFYSNRNSKIDYPVRKRRGRRRKMMKIGRQKIKQESFTYESLSPICNVEPESAVKLELEMKDVIIQIQDSDIMEFG